MTDIKNNMLFKEGRIVNTKIVNETIEIGERKQKFEGMGGALTQSSNINYNMLSRFIRLPIGSCDFCERTYDYLNHNQFDIGPDEIYIHPLLNDIMKYNLTYMASPWSPPRRYKNLFNTRLRKSKFEAYADYLVNYVKYYREYGINIKYLSIQNEPYAIQRWESCKMNTQEQKELIKLLSVKLDDNTSIMLHDHNKKNLSTYVDNTYLINSRTSAVAFHWYDGPHFEELAKVHEKYPELKLIESEMCCGYSCYNEQKWRKDAELYANEIIGNLNNYMNIYMDWNLLLDEFGGPNHKKNYVKAPIIRMRDKIIKTPIYYYLKHFSLHQNSYIYEVKNNIELKVVVSDKYITILNDTKKDISFSILGMTDTIKKHTIVTYKKEA